MEFTIILVAIATLVAMPFYDPKDSSLLLSPREAAANPEKASRRKFLVHLVGAFILAMLTMCLVALAVGVVVGIPWGIYLLITQG